jgi:hypothetical protein
MAIENYPLNGDVSSPGLDSQHLDIACGASGADHRRNAGLGFFGLLFRIASWMASEVLAGCAAYAEAMYPMYTRQHEQPPAIPPALDKQPRSFRSNVHPKAVIPLIFTIEGAD